VAKKASPRKKTTRKSTPSAKRRTAKAAGNPSAKAAAKPGKPKAAAKAKRQAGKGKSPLTKPEQRKYRKLLLEKRRELVGDMTGIEAEAFGADRQEVKGDISDHPADAGTDNFEQEFSLGLLESERVLLAEIDEALERLDQGTYGICLGTGKPITKPRLRARPWAKYCIEYARMIEKGLVRPGERLDEDEET
jgi:DnaK suppressor protein